MNSDKNWPSESRIDAIGQNGNNGEHYEILDKQKEDDDMDLIELQNMIYKQNKELGWHDEPRSFNTFICLFHSELSEALEGDRKGLMDDHLPQYPMCAVEIADFVIRVLDWFGSRNKFVSLVDCDYLAPDFNSVTDYVASLHSFVSDAHNVSIPECKALNMAVGVSFLMANTYGWPLEQIMIEKVAYNKIRADHKRENRAKEGGKKY